MQISPTEAAAYAGSGVGVGASLTLTDMGVIAGVTTAILTFALNAYFSWKKSKLDAKVAEARIREAEAVYKRAQAGDVMVAREVDETEDDEHN